MTNRFDDYFEEDLDFIKGRKKPSHKQLAKEARNFKREVWSF